MTYHLINGDATLPKFERGKVPGQFVIWREVICEGKLVGTPGSMEFVNERIVFFDRFFDVKPSEYKTSFLDELQKLDQLTAEDELVLWFDYTLFGQLNLVGALAYIDQMNFEGTVQMIDTGYDPEENSGGLGHKSPQQILRLYKKRAVRLYKKDVTFGAKVYKTLTNPLPFKFQKILMEENEKFSYLPDAIYFQLLRFPSLENGLNEIENQMLKLVNKGVKSKHELVGKMLQWQDHYSFGDAQYYGYLKFLSPLISLKNTPSLTELGEKVLNNEESFAEHLSFNKFLGGASARNFRWTGEEVVRKS